MRKVEHFVTTGEAEHGSIRVPEVERRIDYDMTNQPDPAVPTRARGRLAFVYTGQKKGYNRKKKSQ
jgi:hypothetical protein